MSASLHNFMSHLQLSTNFVSAVEVTALGYDQRFDLRKSAWLLAGIAGQFVESWAQHDWIKVWKSENMWPGTMDPTVADWCSILVLDCVSGASYWFLHADLWTQVLILWLEPWGPSHGVSAWLMELQWSSLILEKCRKHLSCTDRDFYEHLVGTGCGLRAQT